MKIRAQPFPKTFSDGATTLFLLLATPLTYWFELWIVCPTLMDINSFYYGFNFMLGTFILFNVVSNMMAVMLYNTSIIGERIVPPAVKANATQWKFCSVCESMTPPRSWHCSICRVCILKRDHHCMFTGCCIGHSNQRYFISMVFYLCLGTAYSSVLNTIFIIRMHGNELWTSPTIFKVIFPLAMVIYDATTLQYHLMMYLLNVIGAVFTCFLLFYHLRNMFRGCVTHDALCQFDLGPLENTSIVFGTRWYWAWLSPFVHSPLPYDGIYDWQKIYEKSTKNI